MKKTLILLIAAAILLLTACSDSSQIPETDPPATQIPLARGEFTADDIAIIIDGQTFKCGGDAGAVLGVLGDGYEYSEAISCAYDGLDKKFAYEDYDITTYPDGDMDRVAEIAVYAGNVSTAAGLKIGDTIEKMEDLYGTGYYEAGITLNYQIPASQKDAEGAMLYFTASDGIITSIAITAEMLME